jgi:hypothetical protein
MFKTASSNPNSSLRSNYLCTSSGKDIYIRDSITTDGVCSEENRKWLYNPITNQILHNTFKSCLQQNGSTAILTNCISDDQRQKFEIVNNVIKQGGKCLSTKKILTDYCNDKNISECAIDNSVGMEWGGLDDIYFDDCKDNNVYQTFEKI